MKYFLIAYARSRGTVVEEHEYPATDADGAWAARDLLVSRTVADPDIEVVLLRADARADLAATHARYFKSFQDIVSAA